MCSVKARFYLSAFIYTSVTISLVLGKTESAKNLTHIFVSLICLSAYPHRELCLHCYISFFSFAMKTNSFMINFLTFLCYFPLPVYTVLVLSICPKLVLLFLLPFLSSIFSPLQRQLWK